MRKIGLFILIMLGVAACGNARESSPTVTPSDSSTPTGVAPTEPIESTATAAPTDTTEPTNEPTPTAVPSTKAPTPSTAGLVQKEVSLEQDRGGVVISVEKVSVAPLASMPDEFQSAVQDVEYWKDVQTVGAIKVSVGNNTDKTISVYPSQATIVVGDEQVQTATFWSDDVGGDLFSGVTKEGAVFFGLKRYTSEDVNAVRYVVDAPSDEDFNSLAESDFDFEIPMK
jgi:hypothetical protein